MRLFDLVVLMFRFLWLFCLFARFAVLYVLDLLKCFFDVLMFALDVYACAYPVCEEDARSLREESRAAPEGRLEDSSIYIYMYMYIHVLFVCAFLD